jgi:hypothetical protein
VPELSSDAAHSPVSRHSAQRRGARRYLTGAAGVVAAVALTGAVSAASAAPAPSAPARVVTLTSGSTAPTGHITLQVKYQLKPGARNKLRSVTFSGASKISLKHPALVVSFRPVLPRPFKGQVHAIALTIILRIKNASNFSGALGAKLIASINKNFAGGPRRGLLSDSLLSATVASVSRPKSHQQSITAPVGLQVAVLLGPLLP